MAVQAIRNIINSQIEGQILKAKAQVKTEAKKEILKLKEKLPTIEDLKAQFLSMACSEAAKKKIEFLYNKLDGLLEKLQNISDKIRNKIEEIKNKLQKIIENILPKIAKILGILAIAVVAAKIIIKVTPAAQIANSGPTTSGYLATKLQSLVDKAKKKIKAFGDAIKAFTKKIEKITKVVQTIIKTVFSVLAIITLLGDEITKARDFLLFLYLMYKSQCELNSPSGGLTSGTCTIPEHTTQEACEAAGGIFNNPNQQILNGNTNLLAIQQQIASLYEDLIKELALEGKKEVIETITNVMTQYNFRIERKIVPITTITNTTTTPAPTTTTTATTPTPIIITTTNTGGNGGGGSGGSGGGGGY